ncbi:PH domain-containing protein [Flavobacterium capsici]|uniref:PH domain-containing protein n=1 Tax=Flavobacterium capsici TaxID=3075618 RepID=A0AA96J2X3_9FLAO|nr:MULTISPECIES: PH domain-containing protein [unclassified Flavobacterium]WNM19932.1 PH domain-containing protein [Flavobacterium sp. PMR2A8]WNM21321.1 PH domain-containing protein [Flavobacterium sp. PMTSA4]
MLENLKKILNEDQDPKAIEKITAKLENLLMTNEEVGYIAVQKKPAVTILPDSVIVTNKRIILCKPKNLGLSMEFVDYDWDDIAASFVKEGIFGADFTFTTKTDLTQTIDYLPKNQARKLYTFAKEQLDLLKNPVQNSTLVNEVKNETESSISQVEEIEETPTEEVIDFAEIVPVSGYRDEKQFPGEKLEVSEKGLGELSQDELFSKLQNYKKLLDNGLIMQAEYDKMKAEILSFM